MVRFSRCVEASAPTGLVQHGRPDDDERFVLPPAAAALRRAARPRDRAQLPDGGAERVVRQLAQSAAYLLRPAGRHSYERAGESSPSTSSSSKGNLAGNPGLSGPFFFFFFFQRLANLLLGHQVSKYHLALTVAAACLRARAHAALPATDVEAV